MCFPDSEGASPLWHRSSTEAGGAFALAYPAVSTPTRASALHTVDSSDIFGLTFLVGVKASVLSGRSPETTAARSSIVASNISCHTPGAAATAFGLKHDGSAGISLRVSVSCKECAFRRVCEVSRRMLLSRAQHPQNFEKETSTDWKADKIEMRCPCQLVQL